MEQVPEFWEVDPATWAEVRPIRTATACTVTRQLDDELVESAVLTLDEDIGETYVRAYIDARQGSERERVPVATFLVQTPRRTWDGSVASREAAGYSPLVELRQDMPPIGWTVAKGTNAVSAAGAICEAHCRAPVAMAADSSRLTEAVVADPADTWLDLVRALLDKAGMRVTVAPDGTIGCEPACDAASLAPTWTFSDGEDSVLLPSMEVEVDWYEVPNAVEVVYSDESRSLYARAENTDANSPLSVPSRGRTVLYRETAPELPESPTQADCKALAERLLRDKGSVERSATFTHGWVGNALGAGVRIARSREGTECVAQTVRQVVTLEAGVTVEETATWREDAL